MGRVHIIFKGKEVTQSEFDKIERYVLEYFQSVWSEVKESIELLRKNNSRLVKSEICLAFIGADSLSRFAEIIATEEIESNEGRFRKWFDSFVFNDSNDVYKKHKREINCDSFITWKLRNSLLHFYGLPNLKSEYIGFGTLTDDLIKEFNATVAKNHGDGKRARVINPYRLLEATLSGFLIQLEALKEVILGIDDGKKEKYIHGIVRCYEIIQNEGSVYVPFSRR